MLPNSLHPLDFNFVLHFVIGGNHDREVGVLLQRINVAAKEDVKADALLDLSLHLVDDLAADFLRALRQLRSEFDVVLLNFF